MSHDILEQTDQLKKEQIAEFKIFIKLNQKELDSRQLRVHTALPSFYVFKELYLPLVSLTCILFVVAKKVESKAFKMVGSKS